MGPAFFIFFREILEQGETGGSKPQFEVSPRRIYIRKKVPEPTLRLKDIRPEKIEEALEGAVEMVIEGVPYMVVSGPEPTPKMAMERLPPVELEKKIKEVRVELGVTKRAAIEKLEEISAEEIRIAREIKMVLFRDDEEVALIIILAEA